MLDNQGPKGQKLRVQDKQSRVIEISADTGEIVWSYVGNEENPFKSPTRGRVQRLPNGNTLVADTLPMRAFEVTPDGHIAWRMVMPRYSDKKKPRKLWLWIITARRYPLDAFPFLEAK